MSKRPEENGTSSPAKKKAGSEALSVEDQRAVDAFRDFLRIKTVHPRQADACHEAMTFLGGLAKQHGFEFEVVEPVKDHPIAFFTWRGTKPDLPAILLNSHYDVVPVEREKWNFDPWTAERTDDGKIYGRGTQDMKSVCIQHIEALGRLKARGVTFERTFHMSIVPDEEIGGAEGLLAWTKTDHFKSLKLACGFDEGLASPNDTMTVFGGDRVVWWVRVVCTGNVGHGSRFIENTACEKLHRIMGRLLEFRDSENQKLKDAGRDKACTLKLGDVTTVNCAYMKGGSTANNGETFQMNVVPGRFEAGFDMRITPTISLPDFRKRIDEWVNCEPGCSWEFVPGGKITGEGETMELTKLDETNPWWQALEGAFKKLNIEINKEIFPASTDSTFLRALGLPCFGFSPMNNTPVLMHDHNEYLHEDVFVRGISIFEDLFTAVGNVQA